MKRRLLYLLATTTLAVVAVGNGCFGLISSRLAVPAASAASIGYQDSYAFDMPNDSDSLAKMKAALGLNDEKATILASTKLMARGGIFQNNVVAMNYDQGKTGCAQAGASSTSSCNDTFKDHFGGQNRSLYVYAISYTCENDGGTWKLASGSSSQNENYHIEFTASLLLGGDNNLFSGSTLNKTVQLHWAGYNNITKNPKTVANTVPTSSGVHSAGDLPDACKVSLPKDANNSKAGQTNGSNVKFNIPVMPADANASKTFGTSADSTGGSIDAGGADSSAGASPDCESGGDPLNWIICPIFDGVAGLSDWMFKSIVQPLLRTTPISTDPSSSSYKTWSNFRIYGDIFLVMALLVVVFGQSIGGGIVDAYTAKKVLPRLVAATILINLSIYIVALLVDITNIVGGSLGALMTQPLNGAGAFKITPSGVQTGSILTGLGLTAGLVKVVGGIGEFSQFFSFGLLFIVMPVLLGLLAAFITLVLRQAIILALVLVSPIAFALYCLPNTQQYFRRWWDFLIQTLMVYPIVIVFFSVADILSVTVAGTDSNNLAIGPLSAVISFVLQFLPLIFIPYAFRLAGGALGRVHELMTNYHKRGQEFVKGNQNDPRSARNIARSRASNAFLTSRSNKLGELRERTKGDGPDKLTGWKRRGALAQMRLVNYGYNDLDRKRQTQNELFDKDVSSKVGAGADFLERAFFARQFNGPDGTVVTNKDGKEVQTLRSGRYYSTYKDADGIYKEHNEADVKKSHGMYDGNESQIQTLMKYEMGKVANDEDFYGVDEQGNTIYDPAQIGARLDRKQQPMGSFMANLPQVLSDAKLSTNSAIGSSIGANFAIQNQRKEMKHTQLQPDGTWKQDKHAFVQDFAENMASYGAATGKTSPIKRLQQIEKELQIAEVSGRHLTPAEERSKRDIGLIAAGLDTRLRAGDPSLVQPVGEDGAPQPGGGGGNSGGPARVNAAIQGLIQTVGQRGTAVNPNQDRLF